VPSAFNHATSGMLSGTPHIREHFQVESCCHSQLLVWRNSADGHIRLFSVVSPQPFCGKLLDLFDRLEQVLIQPFIPDCTIKSLDIGILLGLSRLDIL